MGLTAHLDVDPDIVAAVRVAQRFNGVSPMDVLRSDDIEWQVWLALVKNQDWDWAEADTDK